MKYEALLAVSVGIIAILTWLLWRRTRDLSIVLGSVLTYYWTLHGGWTIVKDKLGKAPLDDDFHYQYLELKLFPVALDDDYFWTLALYALFIIVTLITALKLAPRVREVAYSGKPIEIDHKILLALAAVALMISYAIVRPALETAAQLGVSGYLYTREVLPTETPFYTLHQLLNKVGLYSLGFGISVAAAGENARYFVSKPGWRGFVAYGVISFGALYFLMLLGNRHELLVAVIAGMIVYIANSRRVRYVWLAASGAFCFFALVIVEFLRGAAFEDLGENLSLFDLITLWKTAHASNEQFAAHFSMYGALHYNLPLTFGSSFVNLAASVIPRILVPERPPDIYAYYAAGVGAIEGQGYTIHHATGWYLNFGLVGVIVGAVLLGVVWGAALRFSRNLDQQQSLFARVLAIIAPAMFVANLATVLRSGPEAYKAFFFEGFVLPALILTVAAVSARRKSMLDPKNR